MKAASLELRIPPLLVALLAAALMWVAGALWSPWQLPFLLRMLFAAGLAAAGLLVALLGVASFNRARTTLNPMHPGASALVTGGVFAYTRNPMYLGMLLLLAGWAAYIAQPLPALLLAAFVAYLNRYQIGPEERRLAQLFGSAFASYRVSVRRWI